MYRNPFSDGEIESRQAAVRGILEERGLAGAVFAAPESVFWLTGLDHWGYFAPTSSSSRSMAAPCWSPAPWNA